MIAERCHWCGLHNGVHQHGCPHQPKPTCPYVRYSDGGTAHCALAAAEFRGALPLESEAKLAETPPLPPHEHVRDELAAVITRAAAELDGDDWNARTVANRCVSILVLLGVLPEVTEVPRAE